MIEAGHRSHPCVALTSCLRLAVAVALTGLCVGGVAGGEAWAQDEEMLSMEQRALEAPAEETGWRGDAELGYLEQTGNVDSSTLNTSGRMELETTNWRHSVRADLIFTKPSGEDTREQYLLIQRTALKLSRKDYIFERLRYDRNRAQGLQYRVSEVLGYGRRLVNTESMLWDAEVGAGARQSLFNDESYEAEAIGVFITEFDWKFAENADFNEYLAVEAGEINTVTNSVTSLTTRIKDNFSMRLSYDVTHNSNVAEDREKTDTITSATLVYSF